MALMQVTESKASTQAIPTGRRCTVCEHESLNAIDSLLCTATLSNRRIASQFGFSSRAVDNHAKFHLPARIAKSAAKAQEKADSVFRQRLEYLWDTTTDGIKMAKDAARTVTNPETGELCYVGRDLGPLAPLLGQAHRNLELLGNATGELNAGPHNVTNIGHLSVIMPRPELTGSPGSVTGSVIDVPAIGSPADPTSSE